MAASELTIFRMAKGNLGKGNVDFSSGNFRLILVKSNGTALSAQASASTWASLQTDGVSGLVSAGNYSASGILLVNPSWVQNNATWKFDAQDVSLSANGVAHASMRAYIIKQSANDRILGYASFSATTSLAAGDKLTITMPTSGILELT